MGWVKQSFLATLTLFATLALADDLPKNYSSTVSVPAAPPKPVSNQLEGAKNRAGVFWSLDAVGDSDHQDRYQQFQKAFNLSHDRVFPITLGAKIKRAEEKDGNQASFETRLDQAFAALESSDEPALVVGMSSHGTPGTLCPDLGFDRVPYQNVFASLLDRASAFQKKTGKTPRLQIAINACHSGSAETSIQRLLEDPEGPYSDGKKRYRFSVELITGANPDQYAYGMEPFPTLERIAAANKKAGIRRSGDCYFDQNDHATLCLVGYRTPNFNFIRDQTIPTLRGWSSTRPAPDRKPVSPETILETIEKGLVDGISPELLALRLSVDDIKKVSGQLFADLKKPNRRPFAEKLLAKAAPELFDDLASAFGAARAQDKETLATLLCHSQNKLPPDSDLFGSLATLAQNAKGEDRLFYLYCMARLEGAGERLARKFLESGKGGGATQFNSSALLVLVEGAVRKATPLDTAMGYFEKLHAAGQIPFGDYSEILRLKDQLSPQQTETITNVATQLLKGEPRGIPAGFKLLQALSGHEAAVAQGRALLDAEKTPEKRKAYLDALADAKALPLAYATKLNPAQWAEELKRAPVSPLIQGLRTDTADKREAADVFEKRLGELEALPMNTENRDAWVSTLKGLSATRDVLSDATVKKLNGLLVKFVSSPKAEIADAAEDVFWRLRDRANPAVDEALQVVKHNPDFVVRFRALQVVYNSQPVRPEIEKELIEMWKGEKTPKLRGLILRGLTIRAKQHDDKKLGETALIMLNHSLADDTVITRELAAHDFRYFSSVTESDLKSLRKAAQEDSLDYIRDVAKESLAHLEKIGAIKK